MMLLASADSLLMVFMALELLSLPTYALVGIQRRDRASSEASLKYFLFGSFATVLLVFGIALLYAQFGTLSIPRLAEAMRSVDLSTLSSQALVYGGLVLLIVAIGFKVGLVPFHMWLPDAYQGAPTAVTGFMGSAIKLAGFAMAVRVLWGIFLPLAQTWSNGLAVLAVITMFVGNIAALVQDNLKRMFAYSSVSHAGYLMLGVSGVLANGRPSFESLNYYLVVYGLMFLGLFGILTLLDKETRSTDIFHVSGLGFTHPLLGFLFSLFALSAAGIPPTAGFFAKYFVFMDVVKAGKTWFVVLALISSLIGIFYYLRVLVFLYMREPKEALNLRRGGFFMFAALILCATILVYLSIKPQLYY
jgi:NADH-quinone oxidoreductase subunit N